MMLLDLVVDIDLFISKSTLLQELLHRLLLRGTHETGIKRVAGTPQRYSPAGVKLLLPVDRPGFS